eukprot:tig00021179_g19250.t1
MKSSRSSSGPGRASQPGAARSFDGAGMPVHQYAYVISDLHINSSWISGNRYTELFKFMDWVVKPQMSNCRVLVMLGDVIETWQAPFSKMPQTLQEIVETRECRKFIGFLREAIQNGIRVVWVRGNHDYAVGKKEVQKYFHPEIEFADDIYSGIAGVSMAHGHKYDLFNRTSDYKPKLPFTPIQDQPLGYYLCRSDETGRTLVGGSAPSTNVNNDVSDFVGWMTTAMQRGGVPKRPILELMVSKACRLPYCKIASMKIKDRAWTPFGGDEGVPCEMTVDQMVTAWEGLFDAVNDKGADYFRKSIEASLGNYDEWLEDETEFPPNSLVIFGHTHLPVVRKVGSHIYFNSGGWVDDVKENATFIKVELDPTSPTLRALVTPDGRPPVELLNWYSPTVQKPCALTASSGTHMLAGGIGSGISGLVLDPKARPGSQAGQLLADGHVRKMLPLLPLARILPELAANMRPCEIEEESMLTRCIPALGRLDFDGSVDLFMLANFKCPKCEKVTALRYRELTQRLNALNVDVNIGGAKLIGAYRKLLTCNNPRCLQVYASSEGGKKPVSQTQAVDLLVAFVQLLNEPWKSGDEHNRKIKGDHIAAFVLSLQSNFPSLVVNAAAAAKR